MDVTQALRFWHQHNETAMAAIALLFLATLILLVVRSIGADKGGNDAAAGGGKSSLDVEAIETMLRTALAQAPVAAAAGAGAHETPVAGAASGEALAAASSAAAAATKQLAEMKRELEQTQLELAARVAENDANGGPPSSGDEELKRRLKELEGRLAEYEIIEDDIADLSHFKEENVRLREELEALKKAPRATPSSAAAADDGPPRLEAAGVELKAGEDIMKQFAAAVNEQPGSPSEGSSAELAQVAAELAVTEAVNAIMPAANAEPAPVPDSAAAPAESEDPFAGAVDTEKMLAEAASLDDLAAAAGAAIDDASALEQTLDSDKLLQEASAFDDAAGDTVGGEPAPADDLMSEFKDEKKGNG